MTDGLRAVALLAATLTSGLGAGVFLLYAHTIMPGLGSTEDRTFVAAFAAIDRAILNPWFLVGGFFGPLVFGGVAAALGRGRPGLGLLAVAVTLWAMAVVITLAVHVPLNDGLKAAEAGGMGDPRAVRATFAEARWRAWNLVRTGLTLSAFGLLAWASLVAGRAD